MWIFLESVHLRHGFVGSSNGLDKVGGVLLRASGGLLGPDLGLCIAQSAFARWFRLHQELNPGSPLRARVRDAFPDSKCVALSFYAGPERASSQPPSLRIWQGFEFGHK